jgi:hypothetical protein
MGEIDERIGKCVKCGKKEILDDYGWCFDCVQKERRVDKR